MMSAPVWPWRCLNPYEEEGSAVRSLPIPFPSQGTERQRSPFPLAGEGRGGGSIEAPERATVLFLTRRRTCAGITLARMRIEQPLAQAHGLGRHLDQLILLDVGDRALQGERARRRQPDHLV